MSYPVYLRSRLWELLFSILCTVSLGLCILDGFVLPPALYGQTAGLLAYCVPVLLAAFCLAYNRRSAAVGVVLIPVVVVVLLLLARQHTEDGIGIFRTVAVLLPLAVFLLTRTPLGAGLQLALGVLAISGSTFLQYGSRPICLLCFLIGAACLLLCSVYRRQLRQSAAAGSAPGRQGLTGLLLCLLALCLSLGAYQLVVKPLSPPTLEVKLVTQLRHLPVLKKLGISSTIHLPDPGNTSPPQVSQPPLQTPQPTPPASAATQEPPPLIPPQESQLPADTISYQHKDYTLLLIPLSIALCIGGIVCITLLRRKLRLDRMLKLPPDRQLAALYQGISRRLAVCGVPAPGAETPRQWCQRVQARTGALLPAPDSLSRCTEALERVSYGGYAPTQEDSALLLNTYTAIPSLCRRSVGFFPYLRLFFRL